MNRNKILTAQHSTAQHRLDCHVKFGGCQVFFDGLGALL